MPRIVSRPSENRAHANATRAQLVRSWCATYSQQTNHLLAIFVSWGMDLCWKMLGDGEAPLPCTRCSRFYGRPHHLESMRAIIVAHRRSHSYYPVWIIGVSRNRRSALHLRRPANTARRRIRRILRPHLAANPCPLATRPGTPRRQMLLYVPPPRIFESGVFSSVLRPF